MSAEIDSVEAQSQVNGASLEGVVGEMQARLEVVETQLAAYTSCIKGIDPSMIESLAEAMSRRMMLMVRPGTETIPVAELNAGAAGTVQRSFDVSLETPNGLIHSWCGITPVITAHEFATDAQIGVPTITETVFSGGVCTIWVTFSTDADATKHHINTDYFTIVVQVASDNLLNGVLVPAVTKRYNAV